MYHPRFKGEHYQMGVKRGLIFKKCGVTFPLALDDFQLTHGLHSEKILRQIFPEICEEVRGVADALQLNYSHFMAWMLAMGCCMYNLETNIPEVRGCTAFALSRGKQIIYGRNNDLPPFLKAGSKSELYAPQGGNRFILTTSSFINGEEGLNEHGLAVAMTFVATQLRDISPGLNAVFIVRYLLEKADCVASALCLLKELPVSSNCNILLADQSGAMLVQECTPTVKNIRQPVTIANGRIICTVNSFTSESMQKYQLAEENTFSSDLRYRTVLEAAQNITDVEPTVFAQNLLRGAYGFMCQYDKSLNFATIWSSIFDLSTLLILRAEGDPRYAKFGIDSRLQ